MDQRVHSAPRRTPGGGVDMGYYTELARGERRAAVLTWWSAAVRVWRRWERICSHAGVL